MGAVRFSCLRDRCLPAGGRRVLPACERRPVARCDRAHRVADRAADRQRDPQTDSIDHLSIAARGRDAEITELVAEGTRVNEGDLLVRLDTTDLQREIERVRQEVRQSQVDLQVAGDRPSGGGGRGDVGGGRRRRARRRGGAHAAAARGEESGAAPPRARAVAAADGERLHHPRGAEADGRPARAERRGARARAQALPTSSSASPIRVRSSGRISSSRRRKRRSRTRAQGTGGAGAAEARRRAGRELQHLCAASRHGRLRGVPQREPAPEDSRRGSRHREPGTGHDSRKSTGW